MKTRPRRSPDWDRRRLFNYLGDLGTTGWGLLGDNMRTLSLLAVVIGVAALVSWKAASRSHALPESNLVTQRGIQRDAAAPIVARITSADGCRWLDSTKPPEIGDRLAVGRSLHLTAGVVQITFERRQQSDPASAGQLPDRIAEGRAARIGKIDREITSPAAHGFTILTADAKWVDRGTEFGVEVTPGGDSRGHVFQGEVDVTLNVKPAGAPAATQKLLANAGARLEPDAPDLTLYDETGESFIRSMDQVQRNRHTVAFWRFEDHPSGKNVTDTRRNKRPGRGTVDSSFNSNDLFTFTANTPPKFSGDVADPVVVATGQPNHGCLDNTHKPTGGFPTRDLYTWSSSSHAAPIDIQKITPAQWTIEASIKPYWIHGTQTFIGRAGKPSYPVVDVPARLAFQAVGNHLAIRFRDEQDRPHEAVAGGLKLAKKQWYHVAAVSTGQALLLYCDSRDGKGYQLVAKTDLPSSGSTALGKLSDEAEWTVGRGSVAGRPAEWFRGWVDEVRISDIARRAG